MRVLLVDDEVELVSTLAERLSFRSIQVDYATTAESAIQLADENPYDIAVLDVKMPGVRGFEIKKILEKKQPGMRFLFMTGHGSEDDFQMGVAETGESFYLVKPISIDVLIQRMTEALEKQGDGS